MERCWLWRRGWCAAAHGQTERSCGVGGWSRNRTGVHGVAVRCITTLPSSLELADRPPLDATAERIVPRLGWIMPFPLPSQGNRIRECGGCRGRAWRRIGASIQGRRRDAGDSVGFQDVEDARSGDSARRHGLHETRAVARASAWRTSGASGSRGCAPTPRVRALLPPSAGAKRPRQARLTHPVARPRCRARPRSPPWESWPRWSCSRPACPESTHTRTRPAARAPDRRVRKS